MDRFGWTEIGHWEDRSGTVYRMPHVCPLYDIFWLGKVEVKIGRCSKYLGLWFDGKLNFLEHFQRVADKANSWWQTSREVVRLMYINVALSVGLYKVYLSGPTQQKLYTDRKREKIPRVRPRWGILRVPHCFHGGISHLWRREDPYAKMWPGAV